MRKKTIKKVKKTKVIPVVKISAAEERKNKIIELLKNRIPSLFDRLPMGSMSISSLEKLVGDILNI